MSTSHNNRLLVATCLLSALLLGSCSERPADPVYDNPFDPQVPSDIEPPELSLQVLRNDVMLDWTDLDERTFPDGIEELVDGYRVYRGPGPSLAEQQSAAEVEAEEFTFVDRGYQRNATNYYTVVPLATSGPIDLMSSSVSVFMPPTLEIEGEATTVATHEVVLDKVSLGATGGDFLVSNFPDFATALTFSAVPDTFCWELDRNVTGNGDSLAVYLRVDEGGGSFSPSGRWDVTVDFRPPFQVAEAVAGVTDTLVTVRLDTFEGVAAVRYARTEADLATAAWAPPDSFTSFTLAPIAEPQVWAEFESSSFGFTVTSSIEVSPLIPVGEASFTIEQGDEITMRDVVDLDAVAASASYMRYSEDPTFAGVPWIPFEASYEFTLSAGTGEKTIYGVFVNPWDPEGRGAVATILRVAALR